MTQRGALSCLKLSDKVYQKKLLYSQKMPGQMRTVKEEGMKEGCLCSVQVLSQVQKEVWAAVGVKCNANIKKGYTFSKVLNSVGMGTAMCAGNQRETPRHPLPPEVLLSGHQHLMSMGVSSGVCLQQAAAMQLFTVVMAALVYALEWDYLGGLGDWAGMSTSWLRLKPAKTEITGEVQKADGGGEDRKDKPVAALPPNSTAFYTQTKFEAQRSCYRQSWYYTGATSKSLLSSSALGKECVTSHFRCGFLTFTIFWSPQE